MRLLFLCSGLEPGRDGVGDHVRLFAQACAQKGRTCALIALHDPGVTAPVETDDDSIPTLRLPATTPWPGRIAAARAFRERFAPDWISLHLVPYALQPRGLLGPLAADLARLTAGAPLHLMAHELWLGGGKNPPLRERLTGSLQRRGFRRLLRDLRPRLLTTTNPVYAAMLHRLGADPKILPLFGNVPVDLLDPWIFLEPALARAGLTPETRSGWWIGLFFGALHPAWQPEPLLGTLRGASKKAGKRLLLVLAGRAGPAGEKIWQAMTASYAPEITFLHAGEQPAPVLSAWLRLADFGIAATPWHLIGKSGAAAAMLDHGLPLLVPRDDFQPAIPPPEPPSTDPLLHLLDSTLENSLLAGLPRRAARDGAAEAATRLLALLSASNIGR